jgi:hypothetical protein
MLKFLAILVGGSLSESRSEIFNAKEVKTCGFRTVLSHYNKYGE